MSFETDKKKIRHMWETTQANEFNIEATVSVNTIKGTQLVQLPPRTIQFNNLTDIGGSWTNIQGVVNFKDANGLPYADTSAFQWEISATIPETWIPLARWNFAYSRPGGVDPFLGVLVQYQWFVTVEAQSGVDSFGLPTPTSSLRKVTWFIAMSLGSIGATRPPDFTGKLFFTLLNPNLLT